MGKILVTGGAGFIGSHVTDALVARGHDVFVLDDMSGGFKENVASSAELIVGSVTDAELINSVFEREKFDYVYHLAAYAAEGLSSFIKRFNYNNNLMGSVNLINASINTNVKCFVFTSSIAVYGSGVELPLREEHAPRPEDSYGVAKLAVEHELEASRHMFGLNHVIFRPHNVYGERQNIGDKYRNAVGIFMNLMLQDKPMTIYGDGEQQRAFSYIGDMAPVFADVLDMPDAWNTVYNIGADTPYSINQLAEGVAKAMGKTLNKTHLPARNEVVNTYSSHDKFDRVFGKRPGTSLDEGLARMAAWVRAHGARESKKFENIEIEKNFPKAWLTS
jgi:UDP-glucose 4-epimerase